MKEKKKIVVVGGVAGGASVAARVRRLDEFAEITMYDKGPYVSYSNCCIPYHIGGTVENIEDLLLTSPESFKKRYNIDAIVNHEVTDINREEKYVTVKNLQTGEVFQKDYDKLILAPGSHAALPKNIKGVGKDHVFPMKTVPHLEELMDYLDNNEVKNVAVIGGGFIGLEVLENLKEAGYNVSLIEAQKQVLNFLDYDMAQIVHKVLYDQGINMHLGEFALEIEDDKVILASREEVKAEAVIMSAGVIPNTEFAKNSGIDLDEKGYIKTNHNYQTNDPDIYAVGDAILVNDFFTSEETVLALAGPAQKQARAAADHIYGKDIRNNGVIGSVSIKLFDYNIAGTGLNEKDCQEKGINYDFAFIPPMDRVGLMPGAEPIFLKLIYEYPSGKILGGQAISKGEAIKRIDVIATAIKLGATLEDLKDLELTYSPHFSSAKDPVNMAALVGLNVLNGEVKKLPVTKVRDLVEEGAFILDAREESEFKNGHIKGAHNIPLSQFRERLDEIPKDEPVYCHCKTSQRSYNLVRALNQLGYEDVYNLDGSFLGICLYEYFNDQMTGREPIVTEYNFN